MADDDKGSFSDVAKLLAGGVAGIVTLAGTVGAATGGLAFLLRNAAGQMVAALGLAAAAALMATLVTLQPATGRDADDGRIGFRWELRTTMLLVSAVLLFCALGVVVWAQTRLSADPSRPVIGTDLTVSGTGLAIKVTAEGDSLGVDDQLYVSVLGSNSRRPNQLVVFYTGNSGPDVDGHAKQVETVPVPRESGVDDVEITATVQKRATWSPDSYFTCTGDVMNAAAPNQPTRHAARPACVELRGVSFPPQPSPSPTAR